MNKKANYFLVNYIYINYNYFKVTYILKNKRLLNVINYLIDKCLHKLEKEKKKR